MSPDAPREITGLLQAWAGGDKASLDRLIPLVQDEFHDIAHRYMRREHHARILVDAARSRRQQKRSGAVLVVSLDEGRIPSLLPPRRAGGEHGPGMPVQESAAVISTLLDRLHGGAADYTITVPEAPLEQSAERNVSSTS